MSRKRRRRVIPGRAGMRNNFGRQLLLCVLILLVVIAVKKMDTAIVSSTYNMVKGQFTQHITFADMGGGAKNVLGKLKDGTISTIASISGSNKGIKFSSPADIHGTYSASSGDAASGKTIEFYSDEEIQVYAAAGGTVSEIGKDAAGNNYIKIYHGNDMSSIYGGCAATYVQPLEKVKRGQILASVAAGEESVLRFEIWDNGKLIDPAKYMTFE